THLAGAAFDYHADPVVILKGRLVAVALLAVYGLAATFAPGVDLLIILLIFALLPWLTVRARRFRLANTSYRNLRFGFRVDMRRAYGVILGLLLLSALSLGTLYPYADFARARLLVDGSRYGVSGFAFAARAESFFVLYLKALVLYLVGMMLFALGLVLWGALLPAAGLTEAMRPGADPEVIVEGMMTALVTGIVVAGLLVFGSLAVYFMTRRTNLTLSGVRLGPHRLHSRLHARSLFLIYLINILAVMASLGLALPWAAVRLARYRAACTTLWVAGDLDGFVADAAADVDALGDEIGDVFDLDFSL
ncbi:MAG: DUF898 domain-containing protein, partial [Gammaproteobacteria bacterium]|nr:DUF898 domain-containing protein [Gammaproteobacteria bacterium]